MNRKKTGRRRAISPPDCKNFTGYRPCFPGTVCLDECVDPKPRGTRILIVNLEAMGNVLVTTTLLPAIRRKYPETTIFWITLPNAAPLLAHNPFIDRVVLWNPENWMMLLGMDFDIVMNVDKSLHAGAFVKSIRSKKSLGYGIDGNGVIVPLNPEAGENYRLGLDDRLKFKVNKKTSSQLLTEAMGLKFKRDEYILHLSDDELEFCRAYRRREQISESGIVVGLNTGCSPLYPNKKMTIDQHVVLIDALAKVPGVQILLLGGPEDTERNAEIARRVRTRVLSTPTTEGVRKGLCYINLCDVVISGDSFGMHAAIGLRKRVIVWFGVSCPQEIDLFDRGIKLVPDDLRCSPCWKRACPYNLECIQMIDLGRMEEEVRRLAAEHHPLQVSRT